MLRRPVRSSAAKSVGYDKASGVLEVEFSSGRIYRFEGVPELVYRQLLAAKSIGAFLNDRIRDAYPGEEI